MHFELFFSYEQSSGDGSKSSLQLGLVFCEFRSRVVCVRYLHIELMKAKEDRYDRRWVVSSYCWFRPKEYEKAK